MDHTITKGGKFINLPSKFAGRNLTRGDAAYLYDQGRLKPTGEHDTLDEALKAGGSQDKPAQDDPKKKKSLLRKLYEGDVAGMATGD